jgi:hypothetical protein
MDYGVSAPPARHVIVHFHVFKNGGSTIETILEREFGERYATVHGSHASSALDDDDITAFIAGHPHITAISSHHLRYPLPSVRRAVLHECCFLRHPLDRLHSVYSYLRNEPVELGAEDPILVLAQSAGPREFAMRLIDESPHFVSNAQTLFIASGGTFVRPLDEADLAYATAAVRRMAVPGLVSMFDESLVAAEHFLGPTFPSLRLHYVAHNVIRQKSLDQRLEELRSLWGSDVYDELERLNHLDLELCAYTENEIRRRLQLVPHPQGRLMEFQARCSGYRQEFEEARMNYAASY